jgi:hypothetical protein
MSGQVIRGCVRLSVALVVLALGLCSAVLAQGLSDPAHATVTLSDGKLTVTPMTLKPGPLTLVIVNHGKLTHALAIMGTGLQPKRTPVLATGKSATLKVTVKAGAYLVWDPVRSKVSQATKLNVSTANESSSSTAGSSSKSGGSGTYTVGTGSGTAPDLTQTGTMP